MGEGVAGDDVQCLFRSPWQALVSILQTIVLAPLVNSTLPDLYDTTIPGSEIALIIQCTMDISYQHGYLLRRLYLVCSRIRLLKSTYDLRRPYAEEKWPQTT